MIEQITRLDKWRDRNVGGVGLIFYIRVLYSSPFFAHKLKL